MKSYIQKKYRELRSKTTDVIQLDPGEFCRAFSIATNAVITDGTDLPGQLVARINIVKRTMGSSWSAKQVDAFACRFAALLEIVVKHQHELLANELVDRNSDQGAQGFAIALLDAAATEPLVDGRFVLDTLIARAIEIDECG